VRAGTTLPTHGYVVAMSVSAVVTATGGVLALLTLPRRPAARLAPDTVSA
jgi:hypothetical protein